MQSHTIGEAAAKSGVSAKMIRYYESIGLIRPPPRTGARYRTFDDEAIRTLRFVARSRQLGFSLEEIHRLLDLWHDKGRASAEVKQVAVKHIAELEQRIAALGAMKAALSHLADSCHGDDRPDCPIMDELAGGATSETSGRPSRPALS